MASLLKLPIAAVMLFGALFGGGGGFPAEPAAAIARAHAEERGSIGERAPRAKAEVWAVRTWPLRVRNPNTNVVAEVRLYTDLGTVDPEALQVFTRVVNPEGAPLEARVLLLVARAAYALGADSLEVLSGHRSDARGTSKHHTDEALDFKFERVDAGLVAAHLRGYGHVGVGIYTNSATRYVHLDSRPASFHWIDASPPGKTWAEQPLRDDKAEARDRAWTEDDDKPLFLALGVPKRR